MEAGPFGGVCLDRVLSVDDLQNRFASLDNKSESVI